MIAPEPRAVLVTGASGFIGSRLVDRLLGVPAFAAARFVLNDLAEVGARIDPRVRFVAGDFADPVIADRLLTDLPSHVFHLGGILGGAAEARPAEARRVNVEGTLNLFERLHRPADPPRVVFASSIAVFAPPFPAFVDDETWPNPAMVYGAHKRMGEIALEEASARGGIDGLALRLPGVVARPGADAGLKSAFLNQLFFAVRDGEPISLPVGPDATTWLISAPACIDALIAAGTVSTEQLTRRALTLPAQRVRIGDLVEALLARSGGGSAVTYAPDPEIQDQFGGLPPLLTPQAERLGLRHDGDLATLAARAF